MKVRRTKAEKAARRAGKVDTLIQRPLVKWLQINEWAADASLPEPDPSWPDERKKVWFDANKSVRNAPIYLSRSFAMWDTVVRIRASQTAPRRPGVIEIPNQEPQSLEAWKQEAGNIDAETDKIRAQIAASEKKPNGDPES